MLLALAIGFALLESLFTLLEVALGVVSRARLRTLADKSETETPPEVQRQAARTLRVLDRPDRLTILFVTVTSLSLWMVASCLAWQAQHENWPPTLLVGALVLSLFVAEVLPLLVAAHYAEPIALRGAGLVRRADRLLSPLTWLLGLVGRLLAALLGARFDAPPQVTGDELKTALQTAEEEGVIASDERAMLEGAMILGDKRLSEVMTPRTGITAVRAETGLGEALQVGLASGHSRLPVYDGTIDHILGVLAIKDLLPHLRPERSEELCARDVMRPPLFLPESRPIAPALDELRRQRTLMALIVEETGGIAGLVTLEDLLEEIVGEIQDEYDAPAAGWRVETGTLVYDAGVMLREVARAWHEVWDETLQLRTGAGEAVETGLTIGEFALRLGNSPITAGSRLAAGNSATDDGAISPVELEVQRVAVSPPQSLLSPTEEKGDASILPTEIALRKVSDPASPISMPDTL